jgi:pimeloyl-ACP methyl ester carboxylesterase
MPTANVNGFEYFYEEGGSGQPLIMLHGSIAGTAKSLAVHIPELSKDFRLIIPDLRGLGRSQHVAEMPASGWVDDVVGLMDALGIAKAHLYGGAMGSRVALRTAIDHPDRLLSVVLDWTILTNSPEADARLSKMFGPDAAPPQAEMLQRDHGDDWQDVTRFYGKLRNGDDFKTYYDLTEGCKSVSVPTLIVRGDTDDERAEVHPLAHSETAHANIEGSWLGVYPNTKGNLSLTRPDDFYAVLRKFAAQLG